MTEALKRCPFGCGTLPDVVVGVQAGPGAPGFGERLYHCKCPMCLAETGAYSIRSDAVAAWNTRAPEPPQPPAEGGETSALSRAKDAAFHRLFDAWEAWDIPDDTPDEMIEAMEAATWVFFVDPGHKEAALLASLAASEAQAARMRGALNKAADQFAFYADEHAKKGTPEADAKARTNHGWALFCARASGGYVPVVEDPAPEAPGSSDSPGGEGR